MFKPVTRYSEEVQLKVFGYNQHVVLKAEHNSGEE